MELRSPLAVGQERIWLLERLLPGLSVHHITLAYEIDGPLDADALGAAFQAVVARHTPLRTTFHEADGRPYAVVHAEAPPVLRVVDLVAEEELRDRITEVHTALFDLARLPLLRAVLFRLGPQRHALVLVVHHIVADGWSTAVLLDEVRDAYLAHRGGIAWEPEPLPITYGRHVGQERAAARDGRWEADFAYWREALRGAPPLFAMPGTRPRPSRSSQIAHHAEEPFGGASLTELRAFAKRQRASTAMVVAAAWAALLHRHSGAGDIVLGMPVSGRDRAELNGLIGLFINVVPLRVTVTAGMTFAELVDHVRARMLSALEHRRPPFAALVADLGVERSLAYSPVFQVLFNHAARPSQAFAGVAELSVRRIPLAARTMETDLALAAVDGEDDAPMRLGVACSGDLYDEHQPGLLAAQLGALLADGVTAPDTPLHRLRLLDARQQRQLRDWCAPPPTPVPSVAGVLDLIVAQARRTPDRVAVVSATGTLSYAALCAAAARLAARLRAHGVGPGSVVAVHLDRSVAALVAMLSSWQVGAAYLPVDPTYPRRRVEFVLRDAGAAVIVADAGAEPDVAAFGVPVVRSEPEDGGKPADTAGPAPATGPTDPAYLIYTSGSTGRPKGVEVPHGAVVNFLSSMARCPGVEADDAVLALTSPSFDISVLELFLPLTVGARVVVAAPEDARDPQRLIDLIQRHGVTIVQATPVTWGQLVEFWPSGLRLRRALCGGEALARPLANRLCALADEVWNMYGPTETTVWSLVQRVTPAADTAVVPIGRPIDNTSAWVLGADGEVLAPGVPGELVLGGAGLALGYRGQPDLTVERFVSGPVLTGGQRLYRTGDLVRLRGDGVFEFLGRADRQVKIRGHRIELDEIATLLRQHPKVRDAVVVSRDEGEGGPRLVAYVVPA